MKAIINGKLVFPDRICDGAILIDHGKIVASGEVYVPDDIDIIDAKGLYVGPGLIDQHVHGYSSYNERIDAVHDARAVADRHLKHGTTTITPSVAYSNSKDDFYSMIEQCNQAIAAGNTSIMGIHFEGPYTNPARGANSHLAWVYSDQECDEMFAAAKGNVRHCTYAPEMPCAQKVETILARHGVVPDIGHTNSDPENIYRAVRRGAKIVTHLFDAMGNSHENPAETTGDPQDCVSDIVLSIPNLYYELICDSRCIHVTAVSQRQALKNAGEDHIILISDCTGRASVLNHEDYPSEDQRSAKDLNFNLKGQLAGSRLTLSMCAANFKKVTGVDMRVLFKCAATNSAKALGIYDRVGSIDAGKDANVIFVDENFTVKSVYFRGEEVKNVRE